ncbi:MAG: hypothetical protein ACFCVE_12875 [Phycisphaerae bacterium]
MAQPTTGSLDPLSATARQVLQTNIEHAYEALVPVRPATPDVRELLSPLKPADVLSQFPSDHDMAACVLSGLWLWHDFLDESHTISQAVESPSGSFWHAIMHRREGDFSNAKYWYRRTGQHPCMPGIQGKVDDIIKPMSLDKRLLRVTAGGYDPATFVDLVAEAEAGSDAAFKGVCRDIQQVEWRTLFDYCLGMAAGRPSA